MVDNAYKVCLPQTHVHYNIVEQESIPKGHLIAVSKTTIDFLYHLRKKWRKCSRSKDYFMKAYKDGLTKHLCLVMKLRQFWPNIITPKLILLCQMTWMKMCLAHCKKLIWMSHIWELGPSFTSFQEKLSRRQRTRGAFVCSISRRV